MAVVCFGYASNFRFDGAEKLTVDVRISILDGTSELISGFLSVTPATSVATLATSLKMAIKDYAENTMGQSFGLLDSVRLFGALELGI